MLTDGDLEQSLVAMVDGLSDRRYQVPAAHLYADKKKARNIMRELCRRYAEDIRAAE